jgi:hypothetical protein
LPPSDNDFISRDVTMWRNREVRGHCGAFARARARVSRKYTGAWPQ